MRELIGCGGEDGDFARVHLAEHLFDLGRDEQARSELAALKATRRTDGGGWKLAAELLAERGDLSEALVWYSMATERFTPEEHAMLAEPAGWVSQPGMLVRGRRHVRQAMGLPPDETDMSVLDEDEIQRLFRRPMPTMDAAVDTLRARRGMPTEVRMLFWPRSEFEAASARWADLIEEHSAQEYYRNLQRKLEVMASEGARRVSVVACAVDSLAGHLDRTGSDVTDSAARRDYLDARYREGHHVSWPPERNKPCWCGSGSKYKKCCAAPVWT
ncbi:MAG TPA: SEC-C metal-binding domain-containing protein [Jatrophihabitantaceae bacterium]|nr:SEC-C metal-binding domain-containing protein [Jatrophihabitantaceae bacterium]